MPARGRAPGRAVAASRPGLVAAPWSGYKRGVPLHHVIDGPAGAPRIVLVHGFTQTRAAWGPIADDLAGDHEVVRVDAPGHGRSGEDGADLWQGAEMIAEVGGPAIYVGYSMGGRLCLHLALRRPALCRGLVLVGATPGIADAAERAARAAADDVLAGRLEEEGVESFVEGWLRGPLFAGLSPAMRFARARLESRAEGLAASLRAAGVGRQAPLWGRLHELEMPVLAVAGEDDAKFAAIARAMVAAIGEGATLALVPGAGHAAHLEAPAAFVGRLRGWLGAAEGRPR